MNIASIAVICEEQEEERAGAERGQEEQHKMKDEMISPEMTINSLFNKKSGARERDIKWECEGQAEHNLYEEQLKRAGDGDDQNEQQEMMDGMISPEMTLNSLFNMKSRVRERDKKMEIFDRAKLSQSLTRNECAEMGGLMSGVSLISVGQAGELRGAH